MKRIVFVVLLAAALISCYDTSQYEYVGRVVSITSVSSGSWATSFSAAVVLDDGNQIIVRRRPEIKSGDDIWWVVPQGYSYRDGYFDNAGPADYAKRR